MAAERMHVSQRGRCSSVAEEMHQFVHAFLAAEMETGSLLDDT